MRQITADARDAFLNAYEFKRDNTEVTTNGILTELRLHGHLIAQNDNGYIKFSLAGYNTMTTRERLKGACAIVKVKQGVPYLETDRNELIELDSNKVYTLSGTETNFQ